MTIKKKKECIFQMTMIFLSLLISPVVFAQSMPSLEFIIENVASSTIPSEEYSVALSQTFIEKPDGKENAKIEISDNDTDNSLVTYSSLKRIYKPNEKVTTKEKTVIKSESTAKEILSDPSNPYVTVHFDMILKYVLELQDVQITSEQLYGQPTYKITGQKNNNTYSLVLWIDNEHWYIKKMITFIEGSQFSEKIIEYDHINDMYWLPSKIVINHADGSRVIQEFSEYDFVCSN